MKAVNDVRVELQQGRMAGDPKALDRPIGVIWQSCWFYAPIPGKKGTRRCASSAAASDGSNIRVSTARPDETLALVYKEARLLSLERLKTSAVRGNQNEPRGTGP